MNEPELKELCCILDHSKALEAEHAALQRCCKEQETCAAEWEQHANEYEAMLAEAQVVLENAEDRAAQLEEEHLKAKAAEERRGTVCFFLSISHRAALAEAKWGVLCQDRENKLRHQVAALEARVAQLQFSAIQATKPAAPSRLTCKYSMSKPHCHADGKRGRKPPLLSVRCTSLLLWYCF
jgi:hypothetical protein